jgi:putative aminopeptidase FrvX
LSDIGRTVETNPVLKDLLTAAGPSGYEGPAAEVWKSHAGTFADVWSDGIGNAYAEVNAGRTPRLALYGHIDELGFVVTAIDDHGMLRIERLGAWTSTAAVAQRVTVMGRAGAVDGVIGRRFDVGHHELEEGAQPRFNQIWVDVGASDRAAAEELVEIGDPIVTVGPPVDLPGGRIMSRALDDRLGAYCVLEIARRLKDVDGAPNVVAVATVQEETSLAGSIAATATVRPDLALVIDICQATDVPILEGVTLASEGDSIGLDVDNHPLGSGPMISRGAVLSPAIGAALRATASELGIAYTLAGRAYRSMTDADGIPRSGLPVPSGGLSIPTRYGHTPSEIAQLSDVEQVIEVGTAFAVKHAGALAEAVREAAVPRPPRA